MCSSRLWFPSPRTIPYPTFPQYTKAGSVWRGGGEDCKQEVPHGPAGCVVGSQWVTERGLLIFITETLYIPWTDVPKKHH